MLMHFNILHLQSLSPYEGLSKKCKGEIHSIIHYISTFWFDLSIPEVLQLLFNYSFHTLVDSVNFH